MKKMKRNSILKGEKTVPFLLPFGAISQDRCVNTSVLIFPSKRFYPPSFPLASNHSLLLPFTPSLPSFSSFFI